MASGLLDDPILGLVVHGAGPLPRLAIEPGSPSKMVDVCHGNIRHRGSIGKWRRTAQSSQSIASLRTDSLLANASGRTPPCPEPSPLFANARSVAAGR